MPINEVGEQVKSTADENLSFSAKVKIELSLAQPHNECCKKAQAYGLLLFGRSFLPKNISLLTDHECVARAYEKAIVDSVTAAVKFNCSESGKYLVNVSTNVGRNRLLTHFSAESGGMGGRINHANLLNDSGDEFNCCYSAFLRGAFMAAGTITDPNKNYHLEFSASGHKLCEDLVKILLEAGFSAKLAKRRGNSVVYFKDSESIEDLLTFMGAPSSSMTMMEVKVLKDIRNKVNRKNNFDTANISRTACAAVKQIEDIETIQKYMGIDNLPDELRTLALMRMEDFEKSLAELGRALSPPVSRSGINHRFQRIAAIAAQLRAKEDNED